jgi:tetratricopeptide (TPR) repeat protein
MANFANQIFHGDIAMSILGDFEYENLKHDMSAANRTDIGNILTLKDCESLTLRDGRIVQAHEYLNEYERQRDIYYRYWQLMWPIAIGRARAIAVSRNPKIDNRINQAIDILKSEVFEILEKVVPYGEIGPETINFYPNVVREWMLAFESLGIFYLENGDGLLAIECIDKAKRICVAKDDWFRLEKARIIAGTKIERNPTLSPEEEKLVNKLLDRYLVRDDSSKRVNELMAIADKLYWSGDTHRCEKMYYAITAKYPENVEACLNLSNLQKETGRSEDSMKELKRGLSISPKNYKLLCNQGLLLNETGRQHDSIKILKRAIKIFPDDSYTWNNLGNSYYDLGELSKALMAYENAIKLDPSCTEAEVNRNNTLRRIGSIRRTRMDDTPLSHVFINGTCGNCKQRFRIHAEEVLHKDEFTCSNCNAVLDATKPRLMAEAMLKGATMTKKKNS